MLLKRPPRKSHPRPRSNDLAVYIHFPFCLYKCHYCDFNSYATPPDKIPHDNYVHSLLTELERRQRTFEETGRDSAAPGTKITSIFFGGGTPSLMQADHVERLLGALQKNFNLDADAEITLEANPKTVTAEKLAAFRGAGINRLSMGVQSLHDAYLSAFGRIHSAEDAREALTLVAKAGFRSWNADLIFGFPGQKEEEWEKDVAEILQWDPPHLSCYAFTVEEGAPYARMLQQGRVQEPSDDLQTRLFTWTGNFLESHGLPRYEISNFSHAGEESRHNSHYWNYGSYVGLGAGAVSFLKHPSDTGQYGYRTTNKKDPRLYSQMAVDSTMTWYDKESINKDMAMGEFMMMGLRLKEGIDEVLFSDYFGVELKTVFSKVLEKNRMRGWMRRDRTALTEEGFLFSNEVMGDFFGN